MGNYVKNFIETFDFDGDSISVTLKQLKRVDASELLPAITGMKGIDASKPETLTAERIAKSNEFIEKAAKILKEGDYIVSLKGMTIDGKDVLPGSDELATVLTDFYFTGFVSIIAGFLVSHSSITKVEEKKSGEQPNTSSEECREEETRL